MNRPPTTGRLACVLVPWVLIVSACSTTPRPLPDCHGPSRPVNVSATHSEPRHEDRSRT